MSKHDAKTREPRLFPWADDRIEAVVKADFLAFCIYRGYNDEVKRLEWERMRNIEVGRFKRRLAALLGPRVLPPDACPAHGHGEPCFYCGDLCNCWTGNPGLWPLMLPVDPARQGRTVPVHMKCVLTRLGIGKPAPTGAAPARSEGA